jgi:hypothetical protein
MALLCGRAASHIMQLLVPQGRARKRPLEISTSWWKGLGQFRPAAHQGASWGRGSAFWRENWSKQPPFRAQNFDQLVEDPFRISEISGLRPSHFDPSTSLRALPQGSGFTISDVADHDTPKCRLK